MRASRPPGSLLATTLALVALLSCSTPGEEAVAPRPLIVIGFDGGEWSVIRSLWADGKLPNLRSLAERGATADLETAYGVSPVIWATIATGHRADTHGITGFVVPGPRGDIPITSGVRKVPALWNLLTLLSRRVAVLGWYTTWPVEEINGVMISDRVMRDGLGDRVHPPELQSEVDGLLAEIRDLPDEETYPLGVALQDRRVERDLLVERMGPELAAERYDLLLIYFRVIDHLSHFYWRFWEPQNYTKLDPGEVAEKGDWIPAGYERFDRAVGRIIAAVPDGNIIVLSDHGFHSVAEELRIYFDLDRLLHHLGYLEWNDDGVDMSGTQAFTFGATLPAAKKTIRLVDAAAPGLTTRPDLATRRAHLISDLESVHYESGEPVFKVLPAVRGQQGDIEVRVLKPGFSSSISAAGVVFNDVISNFESVTGGHTPDTAGVFIAAGPDIEPGADPEEISIFDITPTVLYGLGLPVAEDFAGRARQGIYTRSFRSSHPLQTVASWGTRSGGVALESAADEEIIEELRALGYLQ